MKMEKLSSLKKFTPALIGTLCGMLNGLFGAGGGIAAVPLLKHREFHSRKHTLLLWRSSYRSPSSVPSYIWSTERSSFPMLGLICRGGLLGAILGALLMQKIPDKLLRKAFGAMIYAAVRLLLR